MQDICCKLSRTAAVVMIFLAACVGSAWASGYAGGVPWQVGDIIVCFGNGTCNVLRIVNGSPVLLDQFSDGATGQTFGVSINNTLHAVVSDDSRPTGSNIEVFSIASLNPNTNPASAIAHTPVTFDGSAGGASFSVKAVPVNHAGNFFVLNGASNGGGPTIVQLSPTGTQVGSAISLSSSCAINQATSMDLSAAADDNGNSLYAYVTSGGTIQQVTLSNGACTKFADFGSGVTLYGIKDIPPKALPQTCGSPITNPAVVCPTDEALLVVATGHTDPDAGETEQGSPDPDAVNVCTNQLLTNSAPVSCALLLDTNPNLQTLTPPLWIANTDYPLLDQNNNPVTILDPLLHLQKVFTAGKSGLQEPNFNQTTITNDNAVIWTESNPKWKFDHPYNTANELIIDGNNHIQQVTQLGTSEPQSSPPAFTSDIPTTGETIDGLVWTDKGGSVWNANTTYPLPNTSAPLNTYIVDGFNPPHVQLATFPPGNVSGTTGPNPPQFSDTQAGGGQVTDGLQWVFFAQGTPDNGGQFSDWHQGTAYCANCPAGTFFQVSSTAQVGANDIWEVLTPGTSGANEPSFYPNGSASMQSVMDNVIIWVDQKSWLPNHPYQNGELVGDAHQHLQQETEPGTSGTTIPGFTSNSPAAGQTSDNAVVWTDLGPSLWSQKTYTSANAAPTVAPLAGTFILDSNHHLEIVTKTGTTGPFQPGSASSPNNPWGINGATTVDGLQWQDQGPPTAIVARYPVNNSPTPTLQGLALDPLITDCTTNPCSSLPLPTPKTSNFWLADSQSANLYKLDFATGANGTPAAINSNGNRSTVCPGCSIVSSIQGIGIYGGEGSNQPGLTKVLKGTANQNGTSQTAFFPLPNDGVTSNTNSMTLSLYNGTTLAQLPPFTVYGSSVPLGSCFFDGTPSLPCTRTTTDPMPTGNAVVWKNDIPLPSSGSLRLDPSTQTLALSFDLPTAFQSFNNNVFVDSFYNTTTGVGLDYPTSRYPSSSGIGTPVNANNQPPTDFGCTYQSPAPKCFKNPGTVPIKFTCNNIPSGFTLPTFGISPSTPWGPRVQIVTPAQAPPAQFCTGAAPNQANATSLAGSAPNLGICSTQLPSSNGKTTYRFDSSLQDWVFNWSVPSTKTRQTYHICTYDDTHNAQTFCIDITVASSCP